MSHLCNLAKSGRVARSIWLARTPRPWLLARTPRAMFTTSRRSLAEPNQHQEQGGTPRFDPILPADESRPPFTAHAIVLSLCVGLLGYSLYKVYRAVTIWPEVLRDDLRQGLKYRNKGNLPLSIQHFQQAWETAKSLPLNLFGPDHLIKTSGIAIVLAGVLEDDGKKEEAYKIYIEALRQIQSTYLDLPPDAPQPDLGMETLKLLTGPERMRAAALAYKLGSMAPELGKPDEEEEKWLTWSVNAILSIMKEPASPPPAKKLHIMAADMGLPPWASGHDLAAPFEALATFYNSRGRTKRSYALPLYLQAIAILIPPPPLKTSPEDRIRGAQLMVEVSLLLLGSAGLEAISHEVNQATSWARKAFDVVNETHQSHKGKYDFAYLRILHHLAMVHKLDDDNDKARELLELFVKESNAMGLEEFAAIGRKGLQELDSEIPDNGKDKLDKTV